MCGLEAEKASFSFFASHSKQPTIVFTGPTAQTWLIVIYFS